MHSLPNTSDVSKIATIMDFCKVALLDKHLDNQILNN